jgi:hypothetical protein
VTATEPTETEVITPDGVTSDAPVEEGPGTAIEAHAAGNAAIEAAADAALAMPGVPGRDEFLALAMQARVLCLSGAAPEAIRNNPYVAFHVAMVGRDLGISPSAAIELIDVIHTAKGPRLSLSPQLLNGQIRRLGLGSIIPQVQERDRCVALALDPNGVVMGTTEFTWQDAQDAELVGPNCQPGAHVKERRQGRNNTTYERCPCNQGYITYPKRMMWWRAAGFCADDWFPEAGLGLYTPEELGAVVDDEGRPIDPSQVALPPGYDEPEPPPAEKREQRKAEAQAKAEAPADTADLLALRGRIGKLPDHIQAKLKEAWNSEGCNVRGYSLRDDAEHILPASKLKIANALVNAWEGTARKEGWDPDAAPAAETPQEAPETDPAPAAQPDVPEAQSNDEGAQSGTAADGLPANPEFDVDAPDEDPSDTVPNGAPEPDNRAIATGLSRTLAKACQDIPDATIAEVAAEVKALHWSKVNAELDQFGVPHAGLHIDVRRMHVSLRRIRAWRAANGLDDVTTDGQPENPIWEPREGEEPF